MTFLSGRGPAVGLCRIVFFSENVCSIPIVFLLICTVLGSVVKLATRITLVMYAVHGWLVLVILLPMSLQPLALVLGFACPKTCDNYGSADPVAVLDDSNPMTFIVLMIGQGQGSFDSLCLGQEAGLSSLAVGHPLWVLKEPIFVHVYGITMGLEASVNIKINIFCTLCSLVFFSVFHVIPVDLCRVCDSKRGPNIPQRSTI